MDHFRATDVMLTPSAAAGEFTRADLVFYGVDHRGPSFEARVFLNAPDADVETALSLESGYAGSFVVFGHGGCYGDAGHCEVPPGPRDPFDLRPPHPMTPLTKFVEITDALQRAREAGNTIEVSVVPMRAGRLQARQVDALSFTALRLLTFR
jgi:tyrosinase